ncbi:MULTISPECIES: preprotein translocase subunit SecG [Odoribacteraceae]|uniref:preprotein translocase subunit SecG n=1 Tax=Odoribacteraceae TaxID=1853231 RepID=UPI000E51920D|nr:MULTISPECIES: preprotein translocase subunit SecG [Odoribacteraceae]MCQ4875819.1 preprotein translocase subunit SecG [Butyricimonas paravirosa]RHR77741.1 preprotein translocase subunit SecG [Odoribacter sp. AF15-53]
MYIAVSILIFIVCALLILIVLVQNSKGGGLSSTFASSNQIMGVRKTTDFLEKATWTLAGAMLVLCIVAAMVIPRGEQAGKKSAIQEQVNTFTPTQQAIPDFGTNNNTTTPASEDNNTTSQEQE